MHHSFWHQRWQEQRIGFHLDTINPYLSEYWPKLNLPEQSRVFVPLCGKSHDLRYFYQQGYRVIGNELSSLAVQDLYTEQQLIASKSVISGKDSVNGTAELTLWSSAVMDVICGDFFAIQKEQLFDISAVYDRAALVALPPEMRDQYVKKLLTLDYDENEKQGPPFSVSQEEVYRHYGAYFDIELLEVTDIAAEKRSPRSQNMNYFNERVFLLTRGE